LKAEKKGREKKKHTRRHCEPIEASIVESKGGGGGGRKGKEEISRATRLDTRMGKKRGGRGTGAIPLLTLLKRGEEGGKKRKGRFCIASCTPRKRAKRTKPDLCIDLRPSKKREGKEKEKKKKVKSLHFLPKKTGGRKKGEEGNRPGDRSFLSRVVRTKKGGKEGGEEGPPLLHLPRNREIGKKKQKGSDKSEPPTLWDDTAIDYESGGEKGEGKEKEAVVLIRRFGRGEAETPSRRSLRKQDPS